MKIKFIHPLWTHLPAVLMLVGMIIYTVLSMPLPDPAPLQFYVHGQPARYGSSWGRTAVFIVIGLWYVVLSAWIDELWARQENRKSFNWMALFDDGMAAALAAIQITYVNMLVSSNYVYQFPWLIVVVATGLAMGLASVLEKLRPYRPHEDRVTAEDVSQVKAEISGLLKSGRTLAYWDVQNPAYSNALAVAVPILTVVIALVRWAQTPWLSILIVLVGLAISTIYGGFRTSVGKDALAVRMGIWGIRLLTLRTTDISSAEVQTYSPLRDFGGYGIRFGKGMKAYFLSGNRGVKVITHSGKKYLIGSDHPERLATVINALVG